MSDYETQTTVTRMSMHNERMMYVMYMYVYYTYHMYMCISAVFTLFCTQPAGMSFVSHPEFFDCRHPVDAAMRNKCTHNTYHFALAG